MIPVNDDNPTERPAIVTVALIAACVLVYLWQMTLGEREGQQAAYALGMIPAVLLGGQRLHPELALVDPWVTLFSSMFLHGGLLHLGGNMLYLWIFGNNVEDALGRVRFILFYLACGVAAALLQAFVDPQSTIPMIGASGAISGVLGAYLLLFPRANVLVLIPLGWFTQLRPLPAVFVLGFYFVLQLISAALDDGQGGVAFYAHIGGFIAGMVLLPLMKRGEVRLFSQKRQPPRPAVRIRRRRRPWDRQQGPWG
jgi:membrane associated rhomboid family serine protease